MKHISQMNKADLKAEILSLDPNAKLDDETNYSLRDTLKDLRVQSPGKVPEPTLAPKPAPKTVKELVSGEIVQTVDPKRYPKAMYIKLDGSMDGASLVWPTTNVYMAPAADPDEEKAMKEAGFGTFQAAGG